MAYSPFTTKFTMSFNQDLWDRIEDIARSKGYSSSRRWISAEMRKLATQYKALAQCTGKKAKKERLYELPEHIETSFKNISCLTGTPIPTLMTMHLLSEILAYMAQDEEGEA